MTQLLERWNAEREASGSNPGRTITQNPKITGDQDSAMISANVSAHEVKFHDRFVLGFYVVYITSI